MTLYFYFKKTNKNKNKFTSDISDKVIPVYTKPFRHDQSRNLKGLFVQM